MKTEQISPNAILEAALKVSTREELAQMPRASLLSLGHLLEQRLLE